MIRIRRTVIERNVTSAASSRRVRERTIGMTLGTLHGGVRARQRERCL